MIRLTEAAESFGDVHWLNFAEFEFSLLFCYILLC